MMSLLAFDCGRGGRRIRRREATASFNWIPGALDTLPLRLSRWLPRWLPRWGRAAGRPGGAIRGDPERPTLRLGESRRGARPSGAGDEGRPCGLVKPSQAPHALDERGPIDLPAVLDGAEEVADQQLQGVGQRYASAASFEEHLVRR